MALYSYVAKDNQGMRLTGLIESSSEQDAIATLHKRSLIVISVREEKAKKISEKGVKLDDLVIFSRQLATMVESGITLVQASAF
jgi:type II secretory pathway component PulF